MGNFLGIKGACRAAGYPKRYAEVFRAIASGSYLGEVRNGPKGRLVDADEVAVFFGGAHGAGAGTTVTAPPRPVPVARSGVPRADVEALRAEVEATQLRTTLASLRAEEERARLRRVQEERDVAQSSIRDRRREEWERWLARWLSFGQAVAARSVAPDFLTTDERQLIADVVDAELRRLWVDPSQFGPSDDEVEPHITLQAFVVALNRFDIRHARQLAALEQAAEMFAAIQNGAMPSEASRAAVLAELRAARLRAHDRQ